MKDNETKQIEHLVAKAMQKASMEIPSVQFTNRVMEALHAQQSAVTSYRPLFPKFIWVAIAALIVGITGYIWFLAEPGSLDLPSFSFAFMKNNVISKEVAAITIPKITSYAVMLLAVMLCVQIPMLKRYFDGRRVI